MRSRKSISMKNKVLIDTSFLLPALGIDVEEEVLEAISLFRRVEIYYLEIGLLEAIWKILKIVPNNKFDRVKIGIEAIRNTYNIMLSPPEAYIEAVKIYRMGHNDFIDALYYATAMINDIPWLTIDYSFIDSLLHNGFRVKGVVITPKEFKEIIKQ